MCPSPWCRGEVSILAGAKTPVLSANPFSLITRVVEPALTVQSRSRLSQRVKIVPTSTACISLDASMAIQRPNQNARRGFENSSKRAGGKADQDARSGVVGAQNAEIGSATKRQTPLVCRKQSTPESVPWELHRAHFFTRDSPPTLLTYLLVYTKLNPNLCVHEAQFTL